MNHLEAIRPPGSRTSRFGILGITLISFQEHGASLPRFLFVRR